MKPHVICHMMSPLDGRLIVADWAASTGHPIEKLVEVYDDLHDQIGADAWICGRTTGEEFADGLDRPYEVSGTAVRPLHNASAGKVTYAVILDPQGRLRWDKSDVNGDHVIVVVSDRVPDSHLVGLKDSGVSYIVSGETIDLQAVLDVLASAFGIKRVMLEGGAKTNGDFLKAGLVDEISYILFPAIGGKSGTPAVFEGGDSGLASTVRLRLNSFVQGPLDTLHIRYDVERAST